MTELTDQQKHDLARKVATALGPDWKYSNPDRDGQIAHWVHVVHKDGYGICLSGGNTRNNPLHISGNYPPKASYGNDRPSINASTDKTPEQIAKDIQRRLLPDYIALWTKVTTDLKRHEDFEQTQARIAKDLFAMVPDINLAAGSKKSFHNPRSGETAPIGFTFYRDNHEGYGDLSVNSENSVDVKLHSLPLDLARQVLKLVVDSMAGTAEVVYECGDQPFTCPKCGGRTEADDRNGDQWIETCAGCQADYAVCNG